MNNNSGVRIPWFLIFIIFITVRIGCRIYGHNKERDIKIEKANKAVTDNKFKQSFEIFALGREHTIFKPKDTTTKGISSGKMIGDLLGFRYDPYDFEHAASQKLLHQLDTLNIYNLDIALPWRKDSINTAFWYLLPNELSICEKKAAKLYAKAILYYELEQFDNHNNALSSLYDCLYHCREQRSIIWRHSLVVGNDILPRSDYEKKLDLSFNSDRNILKRLARRNISMKEAQTDLMPFFSTSKLHDFIEQHKGAKLYEELQLRRALKDYIPDNEIQSLLSKYKYKKAISTFDTSWLRAWDGEDIDFGQEDRGKEEKQSQNSYNPKEFVFNNTIVRPLKLDRIQAALNKDQTIINYYLADTTSYALVTNNNYSELVRLSISYKQLTELVFKLRESIYSYWLNPDASDQKYSSDAKIYTQTAFTLYQRLIQPLEAHLQKELIIIPDESLGYLPFESLIKTIPKTPFEFRNHDYLLNHYIISYSFSSTLWREMCLKQYKYTGGLTAFAPKFSSGLSTNPIITRSSISPLKWNTKEAENVVNLFLGQAFLGSDATVENFTRYTKSSAIVHLATHAKSGNEKESTNFFVLEHESQINEYDIRALQLQSDLVVLSACETGLGHIEKGEGVRSLSKAFAYSGAKSIMSTLWSIDDKKSHDLVINFYKELLNGKRKNSALRNAKLGLISENSHRDAHPFFWSSYVIHGDMAPLKYFQKNY